MTESQNITNQIYRIFNGSMTETKTEDIVENNIKRNSDVQDSTRLSSTSFVYSWTVAKISYCLDFPNATLFSPVFNFENADWRLELQVSPKNNKIKVRLCKMEKGGKGYYINYKVSIFDREGAVVTKQAESKFEGENTVGSKIVFSYKDQKDLLLNAIINEDKLRIFCELSVLTTVICRNPLEQCNGSAKNNGLHKPFEFRTRTTGKAATPATPSRVPRSRERIFTRWRQTRGDKVAFLILVLMAFHITLTFAHRNFLLIQNHKVTKDLIIDTTLKAINIADALNLTEVKTKSLDLLRFFKVNYNISDSDSQENRLFEVNYNISDSDSQENLSRVL